MGPQPSNNELMQPFDLAKCSTIPLLCRVLSLSSSFLMSCVCFAHPEPKIQIVFFRFENLSCHGLDTFSSRRFQIQHTLEPHFNLCVPILKSLSKYSTCADVKSRCCTAANFGSIQRKEGAKLSDGFEPRSLRFFC